MIDRMILLGATGDLAGRFLLPALAALHAAGRLPDGFMVSGTASEDWDDPTFAAHAARRLDRYATDVPEPSRAAVVRSLQYRRADLDDAESVRRLVRDVSSTGAPIAVYLALPTSLAPRTVTALSRAGLPPGSRIVVEKPFGCDLDSAISLDAQLSEFAGSARESAIYRVDHVLGMATVRNLPALRFANRTLESLWTGEHIEQIEILWEETLALEGRAEFYDRVGAVKDVMQNHMLQILCLIAMEPPATMRDRDVQEAKCAVLRSLRTPSGEVSTWARRARYSAGRLADTGGADGRIVPAYVEEDGVDPGNNTETYAEIALELPNDRWAGTRFVLRTGKAMARRRKGVSVTFRPSTTALFRNHLGAEPNRLWIGVDGPDHTTMRLTGIRPDDTSVTPMQLTASTPPDDLPAYGRVLLDVLTGSSTLSVSGQEAEAAWRVLTPILDTWATGQVPMSEYAAGTAGPPSIAPRWAALTENGTQL